MKREDITDMLAFATVAEEGSFTKAAARVGVSQSALSQIVRRLEDRMDVHLLARTTRSVAPTAAGEQLMQRILPLLRGVEEGLEELSEHRDKPSGSIRITTVEHAAKTALVPALSRFLPEYPDITVEIIVDYGLADVVADRFDAGVRLGEHVAKDMIAVPISAEIPMAIVATPGYFKKYPRPRNAKDIAEHRCLNLYLPSSGNINAWRVAQGKNRLARVRMEGPATFNTIDLILDASLNGLGMAYLPHDQVEKHLQDGDLLQVLKKATPPLPPYYLYYPNRRHHSPAFRLLVDALKHPTDEQHE